MANEVSTSTTALAEESLTQPTPGGIYEELPQTMRRYALIGGGVGAVVAIFSSSDIILILSLLIVGAGIGAYTAWMRYRMALGRNVALGYLTLGTLWGLLLGWRVIPVPGAVLWLAGYSLPYSADQIAFWSWIPPLEAMLIGFLFGLGTLQDRRLAGRGRLAWLWYGLAGLLFAWTIFPSPITQLPLSIGASAITGVIGLGIGLYALRAYRDVMLAKRLAYHYIIPAGLVLTILTTLPLIYEVGMGFFHYGIENLTQKPARFLGLQNYVDIIQNHTGVPDFDTYHTFLFTVIWTIVNIVFHVSLGVALAIMLNSPGLKARRIYRAILILPWAVPSYITALVWRNMFDQVGLVNQVFGVFHLPTPDWLAVVPPGPLGQLLPLAFYAALSTNIWLGFPFMMMVASGALQSIPNDLYEAATVDGATGWQRLRYVTLPLLRPAMAPAIMLGTIWTFNNFNVIYLVTAGKPYGLTNILITAAYLMVNPNDQFGLAAAFAVIIFFILFISSTLMNRILRATEAAV